ncbi:MAG: hypothetical protein AAF564_00825 [Bacteroidota bacterium]
MDIHPYLKRWTDLESLYCKHIDEDQWQFTFANGAQITCDVVSFHGTGTIEDLIKERVTRRKGWAITLTFDRDEETFSAHLDTPQQYGITGQTSLNPSIALLSAYLRALQFPPGTSQK